MRIAIRHLEVLDNLAFVPDVIAGRHHFDAEIEQFFRQRRRNAESSRGVFAVGNHQIDRVLLPQLRQTLLDDVPPRASENVTNKKNFQNEVSGLKSWVSDLRKHAIGACPNFDGITQKTGCWLLGADFSRLQKVVVTRGIESQVFHALRVHQHVVEVPQVNCRNISRQDFLNLGI